MLKINEIFYSLQGESSQAGRPCIFIRLSGCNLRCTYCDTRHAYDNGIIMNLDQVMRAIAKYDCPLVLITGGEPLMQEPVFELMDRLLDMRYQVMIETNGSLDIQRIPESVLTVMDIKCPGSGEADKNLFSNIDFIGPVDNVKFVIGDRGDYEWASDVIFDYGIHEFCEALMSPAFGVLEPRVLSEWILHDRMPVRFQMQLHKLVWGAEGNGR